jgi:cell division protein FtsB
VSVKKRRRAPRARRALWPLLGSVTLVGVLLLGVFPTRTFLAQRASTHHAEEQLQVLREQNDELAARVAALNTDAEIERLAREQYNLVRPGEEAYAILPAPPPPLRIPEVWPFVGLQELLEASP